MKGAFVKARGERGSESRSISFKHRIRYHQNRFHSSSQGPALKFNGFLNTLTFSLKGNVWQHGGAGGQNADYGK